ncbi:MAG: glycoside hydrolase family 3 protein [Ferruginibacter sp.]|nr:glycoside hydrolase family 3 protein [Ferruginibacter sp.]
MNKKKTVCLIIITFFIVHCIAQSTTKRVDSILHQMTLKEKIDFIGGYNDFNIRPFKKYGIPQIHMADGPAGVRNNGSSTAFPASITFAASWDNSLAQKVGQAIGMEAKSKNIHIVFGPGMNIYRAAFNGRNFEYLDEDPFLAGEIASSYITGMQSEGVVATAKHYAANFMEYNKHNLK